MEQFKCGNGACIPLSKKCDGNYNDCAGGDDEDNCDTDDHYESGDDYNPKETDKEDDSNVYGEIDNVGYDDVEPTTTVKASTLKPNTVAKSNTVADSGSFKIGQPISLLFIVFCLFLIVA